MKKGNEYQQLINSDIFDKTPKTVLAAIVVSHLVNHQNVDFRDITSELLNEWQILYHQGIVSQKPAKIKKVR